MTPLYEYAKILLIVGILFLLALGSYSDWYTRTVSNKITYSIAFLCLILVILVPRQYTWQYSLISLFYVVGFFIGQFGGADLKVMIPLIFTFSEENLYFFILLVSVCALPFAIKYPKSIPLFIPIFVSYLVISSGLIEHL